MSRARSSISCWLMACVSLVVVLRPNAARAQCAAVPTGWSNLAPQSPAYQYANYSQFGAQYADMPLVFPGGPVGSADAMAQQGMWAEQRIPSQQQATINGQTLFTACPQGACIDSLFAFEGLYAQLTPAQQPALANFAFSDAAFARMRLTVAPLLLQRVASLADLPIPEDTISGLTELLARTGLTLPQLVEAGRVFSQDYRPLTDYIYASPGAFLEIPVGLFFIDGANATTGRLMPLAIRFSVFNSNTYTPLDTTADWVLAKAAFNSLDTAVHAVVHFLNDHLILQNYCTSAKRNLGTAHPLYLMTSKPCELMAGVVAQGLNMLLPNTTGAFDRVLSVAGQAVATKLLPYYFAQYNWEDNYLEADVESRGVDKIPGFSYYADAKALSRALTRYAEAATTPFYPTPQSITGDRQLQAFLADLSVGGPASIPGFPAPSTILTSERLAGIAAQVMWLAGVQHHAVNSDKVYNYDFVYPVSPGKLLAAPPKLKGDLTEQQLLNNILFPAMVMRPDGNITSGLGFFLESQSLGLFFELFLGPENLLGSAYDVPATADCPGSAQLAAASARLDADLAKISAAIRQREDALTGVLPRFSLLDPQNLPFSTNV